MIRSHHHRSLRALAIAVLPLALLATACGSDDGEDPPAEDEAPSDAPADDDAPADEGADADVEAYCTQVDEFVNAMNDLLADPASGDATALSTQGQDLATAATELAGSIDSADTARLQECTEALNSIAE